jgi:hypothetical protein
LRELLKVDGLGMLVEAGQIVVFGAIGLLGLSGSPLWLAAGWALHPLCDVFHYAARARLHPHD